MTPKQFIQWQSTMKLNNAQAAILLGVHRNSIYHYRTGRREISETVSKLCSYIEGDLQPIYDLNELKVEIKDITEEFRKALRGVEPPMN